MALPVTISGTAFPPQNYFCGPFKSSAGNFYVILLDSADLSIIEAWKATDPTASFSEQDGVDKPDLDAVIQSLWAYQVADVLHIASVAQASTTEALAYHRFNMATDNWDEVETVVEAALTNVAVADACSSIAVRSDGDVIILYNGDTDAVHGVDYDRVDYARKEVSWTVGVAVDNGNATDWYGAVIVPGSSDRMHFFFMDFTNFDAYQRTLNSANSLETFPTSFDATLGAGGPKHTFANGVHWTSGANEKVRVPYDLGGELAVLNSADAPTVTKVDSGLAAIAQINSSGIVSLALETNKQYLLYAEDVTKDLFRDNTGADDDTWGTDVEVLDAVTINRISANVYTRGSATELAYVYDDGGTVKYNEYEISGGVATIECQPVAGIASVSNMVVGTPRVTLQSVAGVASLSNLEVATPAGMTLQSVAGIGALPNVELATPARMSLDAIAGAASLPNIDLTIPATLVLQSVAGIGDLPNVEVGTSRLTLQAVAGIAALPNVEVASPGNLALQVVDGVAAVSNVEVGTPRVTLQSVAGVASLSNVEVATPAGMTLQGVAGIASLANLEVATPANLSLGAVAGVASLTNVEVATPGILVPDAIVGIAALPNVEVGTPRVTLQSVAGVASLANVEVATPAPLTLQGVAGIATLPNLEVASPGNLVLQGVAGVASLSNVEVGTPRVTLQGVAGIAALPNVEVSVPAWLTLGAVAGIGNLSNVEVATPTVIVAQAVAGVAALPNVEVGTPRVTLQVVAGVASLANVDLQAPEILPRGGLGFPHTRGKKRLPKTKWQLWVARRRRVEKQ